MSGAVQKSVTGIWTKPVEEVPYEERLGADLEWGLTESSRYFAENSDVNKALTEITKRLDNLGIAYALVGGLALFRHGVRRFTEHVGLLMTRAGHREARKALVGRGYRPVFEGAKNLRDTTNGVRIEFLLTGQFPGDGEEKPISFPDPSTVSETIKGVHHVTLATLVELKIASGMTGKGRSKDIGDVEALVKERNLPLGFGENLNPYVRARYREIWNEVMGATTTTRYARIWRNKFPTLDATSLDEMADTLTESAALLRAMIADGVTLSPQGGTRDDYAYLVTSDPDIARKYDMHDESEFFED